MARQPIPVSVVDDLPSFRRAAASVIAVVDDFILAGEVESGEEALAFLERQSVALVLMDMNMPGMGGIRAAEQIRSRFPQVMVVLMSIHHEADLPRAAASCGARFCQKESFGPHALEFLWAHGGLQQA